MKTNKTLYGLMAFGPLVLILISLIPLFLMMVEMGMLNDGNMPDAAMVNFFAFFGLIMVGSLMSIVSMIMYIVHMSKNRLMPEDQRIFWIIGIVLFNGIVNIVYFFMYITKEEELIAQQQNMNPKSPWD